MQISDRSGDIERLVLTGQITNDIVCGRIASQWPGDGGGLYGSKYANLVGSWCKNYYLHHGKSPRSDITAQFSRWAARTRDSETIALVESFLTSLSEDWLRTSNSIEFTLDRAQEHFSEVSLRSMAQSVQAALDAGDVAGASAIRNTASVPHLAGATWYNPWTDSLAMQEAFAAKADPLITYEGDLGYFLGNTFERDAFVAFRGIAKVGKSFTLMDIAYRALCQKRRVAYFAIGDMSKDQVNLRWASRISRAPRVASTVLIPRGWDEDADPMRPVPAREEKVFTKSLNPNSVMATAAKTLRQKGLDPDFARFSIHPSRSLTVYGLQSILQGWEREGWLPDCIAEGSLVLTDRGLVPIQNVALTDKLWDGLNWVTHQGPICKGICNVITYAGLTATPDHLVYTDDGWRTFEQCRQLGMRIAATGFEGSAVRLGDRYTSHCPPKDASRQDREARVCRLCACAMHAVPAGEVGASGEHSQRAGEGLSGVSTAEAVPKLVLRQGAGGDASLHESQAHGVAPLRRSRDRVSLPIGDGCLSVVDPKSTGQSGSDVGTGPGGQRRPLRAGQYQDVDAKAEHSAYVQTTTNPVDARIQIGEPRCAVCGRHTAEAPQKVDRCGDCGSLGCVDAERQTRVWDIINAGPLHRFTVQGVLVKNCVVIDYIDLLGPIPGVLETRNSIDETWARMRGLSQQYHCLVVTASQSDAQGYKSDVLGMENFNGSRTQNDHVTAIISLNQTKEEHEHGVVRWHMTANRDHPEKRQCAVAGCRAVGSPIILSKFCAPPE